MKRNTAIVLQAAAAVLLFARFGTAAENPRTDDLEKGYRAVILPVSSFQTKTLKPGDYVDVIAAFDQPLVGEKEGVSKAKVTIPVAATIVQNLKVTQIISGTSDASGAVELQANAGEAQWVVWALAYGKGVFLSRRAPGDHEIRPLEQATVNRFLH